MLETALASAQPVSDKPLEFISAKTYHTDGYGAVSLSQERLQRFAKNFASNVRGQEIALNFDHGMDRAKGNQAAGWLKSLTVAPSSKDPALMSLWGTIDFTEDAKSEVADGKWKYLSLEWEDQWRNNDGATIPDVVVGAALTNRPIAKDLMPINFSEVINLEGLSDAQRTEFSVWSTAYVNALPDSAFLYTEASGRHLPYKDSSGKIDLPHLRNAIARIPQMKDVPDATKKSLQAKARAILARMEKAMSEAATLQAIEVLYDAGLDVFNTENSSPDWGRQDPGTNAPLIGDAEQPDPGVTEYVPREQGDPNEEDLAIGSGSRRDPLPKDPNDPSAPNPNSLKGGEQMDAQELQKLFEDISKFLKESDRATVTNAFSEAMAKPEADRAEAVAKCFGEIFTEYASLKANEFVNDEEKRFAEAFPKIWREQQEQKATIRENAAKSFSEGVAKIKVAKGEQLVPTKQGLSALASGEVAKAHKAFSEGSGTVADFENAVSAIVNGGIVNFGEEGSSIPAEVDAVDLASLEGIAAGKRLFADKVNEVQASDEFKDKPFAAAFSEAATKYPELYKAYQATPVVR